MNVINGLLRWIGKQRWIRFGIRDRLLRLGCNPDTTAPSPFEADYFGLSYRGSLDSFIDWSVYFYGAYEREELFLLRDLVAGVSRPVFIDVGANVGVYSMFMSRHCSRVHSFEPNPMVRRRLEENVSSNALRNVTVHPVGMGVEEAELPFFAPVGRNQGTGSFVEGYSRNNSAYGTLRVVNGDDYLSGLALERVDVIKIDAEGFETRVLRGLASTIQRHRPAVMLEVSQFSLNGGLNLAELRQMFPEDYVIHRISCDRPVGWIFNRASYKLEPLSFNGLGANVLARPEADGPQGA